MIYLKLFLTFLKIGAFTFGGGYAMLPMIQEEVLKNAWLSNEEVINFIAVSESTPGPFAVNMSTFVGYRCGGIPGALCSTVGVVLPSFLMILFVATLFEKFQKSRVVKGCMAGLRPAVVALIGCAVFTTWQSVFPKLAVDAVEQFTLSKLLNAEFACSILIFFISLILVFKKFHPIKVIGCSAVLGIAASQLL